MHSDQRDDVGELRREIAFRRAIEQSVLAGITVVDANGVQTYVNRAFSELVGFAPEELVGAAPPYRYWPPEERARIEEAFRATVRGDASEGGFELRFCRSDGQRFDALVLVSELRDTAGEVSAWVGVTFDITDRKRMEQSLRDSEGRLRLAHAVGRMGTWEWRIDEGVVVWSPELEAIFGLEPATFEGTFEAFARGVHEGDRARVLAAIERAARDPSIELHGEYRGLRPDGRVLWLESRGRRVDGPSRRMVGVCSDVTERRRLEDRRRLLADASAVLSATLDPDETLRNAARVTVPRLADLCVVHLLDERGELRLVEVAHADPAKAALAREHESRWPTDRDAPVGAPRAIRERRGILQPRIPRERLALAAQSEEHLRTIEALAPRSSIVVPLEARGRVLGAITLVTTDSGRELDEADLELAKDLADRAALAMDNARLFAEAERARVQAEVSAQRLRVLAAATDAMASALDDDAALSALADVAVESLADYCVTYAYEPDGTIRRVGLAHRDPEKRRLVEDLVRAGAPHVDDEYGAGRAIRTGEPIFAPEIPEDLFARATQNEAHRAVLRMLSPRSSIVVPLTARGRTLGAVAFTATDDSGRRYGEDDLVLANALASRAAMLVDNARLYREAQSAVRARDEMVAAVSHDLRSPLQVILNAAELASEDRRASADALAMIVRAADQMKRFVHGLLDIARIRAGRVALELSGVDVAALVEEAVSLNAPIAEEKSVTLAFRVDEALPAVRADANGLRQVLANLIGNAVKFVAEGGHVRVVARSDERHVRVAVTDDGPGIAPAQLPHVFDRFWQAESAGGRGAGLGLAIAKGIVDAHGGEIRVESELGRGTTFEILLPRDGSSER